MFCSGANGTKQQEDRFSWPSLAIMQTSHPAYFSIPHVLLLVRLLLLLLHLLLLLLLKLARACCSFAGSNHWLLLLLLQQHLSKHI